MNKIKVLIKEKKSSELINYILFIIGLMTVFCFVWFITRYRFLNGDDCLGQIRNSIDFYRDSMKDTVVLGPVISNISDNLIATIHGYKYFGGRFFGYFMSGLIAIVGQKVTAIVSGLVYVILICLILHNISPEDKQNNTYFNVLLIPVLFCFIVFFNPYIGEMFMWTMVSHYVMPATLMLAYFTVASKFFFPGKVSCEGKDKETVDIKYIVLLNIFGFIAGFTQEAVVPTFLAVFGVYLLLHLGEMRFGFAKTLVYNIGLFIGFALCVLAPGNRARMKESHDAADFNRPFFTKLVESWGRHYYAITSGDNKVVIYEVVALVILTILVLLLSEDYQEITTKALPFAVGFVASIVVWGFASHTVGYGMITPLVLFSMMILTPISYVYSSLKEKYVKVTTIVEILCIAGFCIALYAGNHSWMNDLKNTREVWDAKISEANQGDIVEVPEFPKSCKNRFTEYNGVNSVERLAQADYKLVFGCTIVPVGHESE